MNKGQAIGMGLATLVTGLLLTKRKDSVDSSNPPNSTDSDSDARQRVVDAARSQIGPQDPAKYWGETMPSLSPAQVAQYAQSRAWCGGFALWAIKQAGIAPDLNWVDGKGFCYQLPTTRDPQPGDVAYFDQPYQHHAIVVNVDGGTLYTIDGNQARNTVAERTRSVSSATAFYSIQPLIQASV